MALILYIIIGIGLVATIATVVCLVHEPDVAAHAFEYQQEKKVIDKGCWGPLRDELVDSNHIQSLTLPKITFEEVVTAGGER